MGQRHPSPLPGNGGKEGMDEACAGAHPRTLEKEDLHWGCRRLWEAPQDLCSGGPLHASSGLGVLGLVQSALLCDCTVPVIGQCGPSGRGCHEGDQALPAPTNLGRHHAEPPGRRRWKRGGPPRLGREGTLLGPREVGSQDRDLQVDSTSSSLCCHSLVFNSFSQCG